MLQSSLRTQSHRLRVGAGKGSWLAVSLWPQSLICKMGANGKEKPTEVILRKINRGCSSPTLMKQGILGAASVHRRGWPMGSGPTFSSESGRSRLALHAGRLASLKRRVGTDGAREEGGAPGCQGSAAVCPRPESWACSERGAGNALDHSPPPFLLLLLHPRMETKATMHLVGPEQGEEGKRGRGQRGDTCPVLPSGGHVPSQGGRGCCQTSAE